LNPARVLILKKHPQPCRKTTEGERGCRLILRSKKHHGRGSSGKAIAFRRKKKHCSWGGGEKVNQEGNLGILFPECEPAFKRKGIHLRTETVLALGTVDIES